MILMFPVPASVAKLMDGVQKKKMKAVSELLLVLSDRSFISLQTDARVQNVTESELAHLGTVYIADML